MMVIPDKSKKTESAVLAPSASAVRALCFARTVFRDKRLEIPQTRENSQF